MPKRTPTGQGSDLSKKWIAPNGVEYDNEVALWYYSELGYCGCGNPQAIATLFRDWLLALDAKLPSGDTDWSKREALPGWDSPLALLMLYQLDKFGYTEHGGSVFSCWLDPEGDRVIKMLMSHDLEKAL